MPAGERRGRTKAAPQAEENVNGEKDFRAYAEKDLTPLQEDFVEWLTNEVGVDPDPKSVQLGVVLYHDFQASDFNKERKAERREQAAADAEQARQEREEAREAKAQAKAAKAEAEAAQKEADKAAAKAETAPAKATGTRRGRPAKAAATEESTTPARRRGRPKASTAAPY